MGSTEGKGMTMRWACVAMIVGLGLAGCARTPSTEVVVLPAVYCYNTMSGSADCYGVPLESEVRRLNGYYGPDPVNRGFYGQRAF
jgi:hypothetical protein